MALLIVNLLVLALLVLALLDTRLAVMVKRERGQ